MEGYAVWMTVGGMLLLALAGFLQGSKEAQKWPWHTPVTLAAHRAFDKAQEEEFREVVREVRRITHAREIRARRIVRGARTMSGTETVYEVCADGLCLEANISVTGGRLMFKMWGLCPLCGKRVLSEMYVGDLKGIGHYLQAFRPENHFKPGEDVSCGWRAFYSMKKEEDGCISKLS